MRRHITLFACILVLSLSTTSSTLPSLDPLPFQQTHSIHIEAKTPNKVLYQYHLALEKNAYLYRTYKEPPFFVQQTTGLLASELLALLYPPGERTPQVTLDVIDPKCHQDKDSVVDEVQEENKDEENASPETSSEPQEDKPPKKKDKYSLKENSTMPVIRCVVDYQIPARPKDDPPRSAMAFRVLLSVQSYNLGVLNETKATPEAERDGVPTSIEVDLSLGEDGSAVNTNTLEMFVEKKMISTMKLIQVTEQSVVEKKGEAVQDEEGGEKKEDKNEEL